MQQAPTARDARAPRNIVDMLSPDNADILVVAHRGVWTSAPENSLASIRAAIALGIDMVEIDAQSSADGVVVVMHDETLDRTSDASGLVSAKEAAILAAARLRAGEGGPEKDVTAERIPTLAEALEEARGRILVNIDTKFSRDLDAVTKTALDLGMADGVLIKAEIDPDDERASLEDLAFFGQLPFMPILKARDGRFADDLRRIERLAAPMVESHFDALDALAQGREALRRQGTRLWVNTLDCSHSLDFNDGRALADPDAVWGRLAQAGVGAIQTDRSKELMAWLKARGLRRASR